MDDKFTRSKWLFGENFKKLENSRVLVCGCGGVGGACIEALARTGVGEIWALDFERFEITNQNRQLGSENLGELKASVFERRFENVRGLNLRLDENSIKELDFTRFDAVVDAIDDIKAKILLAQMCHKHGVAFFCSLGSAKRIDPTKLRVASIWDTSGDAFGSKFRYELRRAGFGGDFTCVYSLEASRCKVMGSCMSVTASAGLMLSSLVIKRVIGENS